MKRQEGFWICACGAPMERPNEKRDVWRCPFCLKTCIASMAKRAGKRVFVKSWDCAVTAYGVRYEGYLVTMRAGRVWVDSLTGRLRRIAANTPMRLYREDR